MLGHVSPMALDILEIALSLTLTLGPDCVGSMVTHFLSPIMQFQEELP